MCVCVLRYCPTCKNDTNEVVKAGEKLKTSKKKAKMPSATNGSQRDWGKVSGVTHLSISLLIISPEHLAPEYLT